VARNSGVPESDNISVSTQGTANLMAVLDCKAFLLVFMKSSQTSVINFTPQFGRKGVQFADGSQVWTFLTWTESTSVTLVSTN